MDLHAARRAKADRASMERYGTSASLALVDGRWIVDPMGRAGIRPRPE
jgi:predicted metalloenzyme YecM